MRYTAITRARIWGYTNSWSLAPSLRQKGPDQECDVRLEIQGNKKHGYHLIMAPEGFFTADSHHPTIDDVMAAAEELFGVTREQWVESPN
jgi:hypothetical protein